MKVDELSFRCVRCIKCPLNTPAMDPASFQEHFALEHMSIQSFKCSCGKKFATMLYASLHTCEDKKIEHIMNCNAPNLDARLIAVCIALNDGIKLGQKEAFLEFERITTFRLQKEIREKVRNEIMDEIRQENSKKAAKENLVSSDVDEKQKKTIDLKDKIERLAFTFTQSPQIKTTYGQREVKEAKSPSLGQRVQARLASTEEAAPETSKLTTSIPSGKVGELLQKIDKGFAIIDQALKKPHTAKEVEPRPPTPKKAKDQSYAILLSSDSDDDSLHVSNDPRDIAITVTMNERPSRCLDGRVSYPKRNQ